MVWEDVVAIVTTPVPLFLIVWKRPELPTAVGRVIVMVLVQSIVEVRDVAVKFADLAI